MRNWRNISSKILFRMQKVRITSQREKGWVCNVKQDQDKIMVGKSKAKDQCRHSFRIKKNICFKQDKDGYGLIETEQLNESSDE